MVSSMAPKLSLPVLSLLLVACSDDVSEAVTGGTSTASDVFTTNDDVDDTFDSDTTPPDTTSQPTTVTTFDTSVTDSDTIDTITDSDTFDTSVTDSDTFDTSLTDSESDSESESDTVSSTSSGSSSTDTATTSDATTTDATTSDATTSDATTSDATTTDATTTDATTSSTDTGTETDTDTDTGGGGFGEAPPFGTNILDLDLVGVWGLNWDPASGFDSVIDIDDMGNFAWTETSADCTDSSLASGYLWVEGSQVVMHVETWDRPLPWDTEPVVGETFDPPFRLRMSFSLQGSAGDAYLALAAPSRVTEAAPYTGESYVQTVAQGDFLAGTWHGEAQLEAIPAGEVDPVVVVIDRYDALLDPENAADDPQGTGTRVVNTTYYLPDPDVAFDVFDGANWTCLGGCPDPSGTTLVDGGNLYTYGPYGGQQHLLTFADGRTFRLGFASDCN